MYMVIYLSPADYHRFHSPAIHTGDYRRHVVGYLSPVKPSHVNKHKDVFKNNERVNIFGRWEQGFYFESAVGATNVGSIKLDFDTEVLTNKMLPAYPYFEDKSYVTSSSAEKAGPFNEYLKQSDFSVESNNSLKRRLSPWDDTVCTRGWNADGETRLFCVVICVVICVEKSALETRFVA